MNNLNIPPTEPQFTGRYLVSLEQSRLDDGIREVSNLVGLSSVATATDLNQDPSLANSANVIVLDTIGIAIINQPLEDEQLQAVSTASADTTSPILAIEPEQYFYALADTGYRSVDRVPPNLANGVSIDYLRGYRDAVDILVDNLMPKNSGVSSTQITGRPNETWGLQITKVVNSNYSGKGIKVAVLDTGFDFTHPDFIGRQIVSKSFVLKMVNGKYEPVPVQDVNGHGTHCVGTACGSRQPRKLPSYGIAYGAEIYVGKVLNDAGMGITGEIAAGINWAVSEGCHIISMSLGSPKKPGTPFLKVYEDAARRALSAGTLVIAASGNSRHDPNKDGKTAIYRPADCPSVLAVAAVDSQTQIASFSSASDGQQGGEVNIAAPGVDIYSSYVAVTRGLGSPTGGYSRLNGTSMATPHVAGIAALYSEATGAKGQALWNLLMQNALPLPLPAVDVGAGLVQAP